MPRVLPSRNTVNKRRVHSVGVLDRERADGGLTDSEQSVPPSTMYSSSAPN
jgi:hypothetical protein